MAEVSQLREKITRLEAQVPDQSVTLQDGKTKIISSPLPKLKGQQEASQQNPSPSLGRRKLLQRLAGFMLAGVWAAALGGGEAQARVITRSGNPGAIIVPSGTSVAGDLNNGANLGLIASALPTLNLSGFGSYNIGAYGAGNYAGVYGYGSGQEAQAGVYGYTDVATAVGVYGQGGNYGVKGIGSVGDYGKGNGGVVGDGTVQGVVGYGDKAVSGSGGTTGFYGSGGTTGFYGSGGLGGKFSGASASHSIGVISSVGIDVNLADFSPNFIGGVYAKVNSGPEVFGYAIYGSDNGTGGFSRAGYFEGGVEVTDYLTASKKYFKIDHPLDPGNKYLYHTSVKSPNMLNLYTGNVTLDLRGEATITMPDWFEALNRDFRYQLTPIGEASPNLHLAGKLKDRKFKIGGGQPGQEVSWQVTGI